MLLTGYELLLTNICNFQIFAQEQKTKIRFLLVSEKQFYFQFLDSTKHLDCWPAGLIRFNQLDRRKILNII